MTYPENESRSPGHVVAVSAALIIIAFFAFSTYAFNGHPVSIASLSSINMTSTEKDVTALLGEPAKINAAGYNVQWVYSGITWCIVKVEFGPDGKVVSVEHDH